MIKLVGEARMEKEPEQEKIEILPEILNELTSKKAFIFEGNLKSSDEE